LSRGKAAKVWAHKALKFPENHKERVGRGRLFFGYKSTINTVGNREMIKILSDVKRLQSEVRNGMILVNTAIYRAVRFLRYIRP
jgi:hypothetical protein